MGRGLPGRASAVILGVALAGVACVALRIPEVVHWNSADVLAWICLSAAITATEQFQISMRHRTERQLFSLTDALWMAALLLVRPSILSFAVATGIVTGQVLQRLPFYKIAFNVGQFLLGVSAAEVVYHSTVTADPTAPQAWLAAILGMGAYFMVNAGLVAMVISVVERKRFMGVFVPPLPLNLMNWAGNMAIGILGALVWLTNHVAVPFIVVPLAMSYFGYRGWLQGIQERDRMRDLYEGGRALFGPLDEALDFRPFLLPVERMLDATAVELVLVDGRQVTVHDAEGSLSLTSDEGAARAAPLAYVRVRDGVSPQISTIGSREDPRGVLAVYRARPLSPAERSLLDALASQVFVRLENWRLFAETQEQRTQLAEIFGHTSDGIFVVSPDHRMLSWNPAMQRLTGFPAVEAVGRTWEELFRTPQSEADQLGMDEGNDGPREARQVSVVRRDGARRWISYTANPIRDREAGLKGFVVVARDVTADLEADQLKADFVATVSHELRTPLTPLKGFLSSLLQGTVEDSPEAREEYYRIMLNQANRLERLITDLLEVSRIESSDQRVDTQAVELLALMEQQVSEFSRQEPNRRFSFEGPEMPVLVRADPFRVGQVMANLLSNASKYSPPGTPVEIGLSADGELAIVSVRDHGEGIALEDQERVFERFHRLDNGLTRTQGGTGLGLYIAKRLMEAMEGHLWLVSQPGGGSTFSFSLPLAGMPRGAPREEDRSGQSVPA